MNKVQKIKEWISKTQDGLMDANGNFEYLEHEGAFHILSNLDCYIDSLQEEPVSEDFLSKVDKQAKCIWDEINTGHEYSIIDSYNQFYGICMQIAESIKEEPVSGDLEEASKEWLRPQLDKSYSNYGEAKMMELTHFDGYAMLDAIDFGAKWQKEHLWKPADGDDLPEIGREVVAFQEIFPTKVDALSLFKIVMAHRPNPKGYDGKSITTGEIEHYTPKTYDKGGWNIPNIKCWLDCLIPKEIEL